MTQQTYTVLLPYASTPKGREDQNKEIKIVHAAMKEARLKPFVGNGVITFKDKKNVSSIEVEQVLESNVVVFDANCYETAEYYGLSPFLYYFLGVRHAMGNQTIIVTKTDHHLPASFQQHHTLIYEDEGDWEQIEEYKGRLVRVVQQILSGEDKKAPDNPIQNHISQAILEAREHALEEMTAAEQAAQTRIAEMQAILDAYEHARQTQFQASQRPSTEPIKFYPLGKKE